MNTNKLPYTNQALVVGIISVVLSWVTFFFLWIVSLILGIFTLRWTSKSLEIYAENPDAYKDVEIVKIAQLLAIVAIVPSALFGILFILIGIPYSLYDLLWAA